MKFLIFLLLLSSATAEANTIRSRGNIESLSPEHVDYINELKTTWRATANFEGYKLQQLKGLCGTIMNGLNEIPILSEVDPIHVNGFPKEFDSRKQWPKCTAVISHIRDQGSCGSCWAVSVASAITDRVCIATGGKNTTHLSAQQITSCCTDCFRDEGCRGGIPVEAWYYWVKKGVVSGGDFRDKKTCQPYLIPPCEHHVNGTRPSCASAGDLPTPKCSKKCSNEGIQFDNDRVFGKKADELSPSVSKIKTELMERGPMSANFVVYDDFLLYKEGIYQVTEGAKRLGGHAIVVIGWGTDESTGIEYWIAKNNWNTDWGMNGYFHIRMGVAGINQEFAYGIAKV